MARLRLRENQFGGRNGGLERLFNLGQTCAVPHSPHYPALPTHPSILPSVYLRWSFKCLKLMDSMSVFSLFLPKGRAVIPHGFKWNVKWHNARDPFRGAFLCACVLICVCMLMCVCVNMLKSPPKPFPCLEPHINIVNKQIGTLERERNAKSFKLQGLM